MHRSRNVSSQQPLKAVISLSVSFGLCNLSRVKETKEIVLSFTVLFFQKYRAAVKVRPTTILGFRSEVSPGRRSMLVLVLRIAMINDCSSIMKINEVTLNLVSAASIYERCLDQ